MKRRFLNKSKLLASILLAIVSTIAFVSGAHARNLYVSPSGDNSTGDSWKTAWTSFTAIDWKQVVTGDFIIVDGGAVSTEYNGAFTIPASGIVIRQAREKGRNGQVIIRGSGFPVQTGVTITGSNVRIVGNKRSGIKITLFGAECVRVQSTGNVLRNVEIGSVTGFPPYGQGRVGALVFGGYNNHFVNCDLRDTSRCAVEQPVTGAQNVTVFNGCTFGNVYYGWWGEWGIGIYGARETSPEANSTIHARHCVFGPVLNKGIDVVRGKLAVSDSLFLGSNKANLSFEPTNTASTAKVVVNNCTLYEPNFSGPSQYGMLLRNISTSGYGNLKVANSIVYGGVVYVPATQVINAGGNVQYHVTGNTTALAPDIVDPQYVSEADLWRPVISSTISPRAWTTQSYALSETSPALGKGSTITNVTSIVPAYGPAGPLPPLGGP